jgi:hypothetical protein
MKIFVGFLIIIIVFLGYVINMKQRTIDSYRKLTTEIYYSNSNISNLESFKNLNDVVFINRLKNK